MTITLTPQQREALARLAGTANARRFRRLVCADGKRIGWIRDFQVLHSAGFVRATDDGRSRRQTYEITTRGLAYLQSTADTP